MFEYPNLLEGRRLRKLSKRTKDLRPKKNAFVLELGLTFWINSQINSLKKAEFCGRKHKKSKKQHKIEIYLE